MNNKTCSMDALAVFVKKTVILTGELIHTFRGHRGTEFTRAEFRQYWPEVNIKMEFASPNTPRQIGAIERAGRTILKIVRWFLADFTLPNFLWGELMTTAVYQSNQTPHAALLNGMPYTAFYGKDAYLGHLRVIRSRAFVHEQIHTNKLEHSAWGGRLVEFVEESKSYRIYNSETRRVRVSQMLSSLRRLLSRPRWTRRALTTGS